MMQYQNFSMGAIGGYEEEYMNLEHPPNKSIQKQEKN